MESSSYSKGETLCHAPCDRKSLLLPRVRDVIPSPSFLPFLIFSLISFLVHARAHTRTHTTFLPYANITLAKITLVYPLDSMLLLQLLQKLH